MANEEARPERKKSFDKKIAKIAPSKDRMRGRRGGMGVMDEARNEQRNRWAAAKGFIEADDRLLLF
jgi:hypothetical protein